MSKKRAARMSGQFDKVPDKNGLRRCVYCGRWRPLSEFPRNGHDADGMPRHRHDCRTCYNVRRKENSQKKVHNDFVGGMRRRGEVDVAYSHQEWKETVIFFGGECAYCGRTMKKGERLTRDHLVPVAEGGTTCQENIVPACSSCNSSKGKSEWHEWFMRQPFFSQERMNRIFKWRSIMRSIGSNDKELTR